MSALSTFAYRARDGSGKVINGTLSAATAQEVGLRLRAEGKFVLNVSEHSLSDPVLDDREFQLNEQAKHVRREDVIAFCQQLSVMLETGVPLVEAMDSFVKQTQRKELRVVVEALREDLCAGESFSVAISRWPRVFPSLMVSLMKASEASGTMAMMLGRIASYLGKERRTARQIKGALGYPMFMMVVAVTLTIFLMAFVLPRFASIYDMRAAALPRPTQILLGLSEFVTTQYMIYVPALAAVIAGGYFWARTPSGRRVLDWVRLNTPLIGAMYRQLYLTRTTRTMGTLLSAGVSLLDIIDICRGVTNNAYYDDLWEETANAVREGRQFSDAMTGPRGADLIPPNVGSMIASGERSGRLAEVMERIAEHSEEELDTAVKQSTAYIEPAMIILMGALVGGVALALLLPIFSMGNMMSGG
jgi:type IV pilus assembly protein PilC